MTDTPEAVRLADWLQAAVQTYPQVSADEPGGYCSEMDQMIDQDAALLRRIPEIEAERDQLRAELEKVRVPEGWQLVAAKGFDDLMYWLDRCESKGHLENCCDLVEPWAAFDYREVSIPTPPNADQKGAA